MGNDKQRPILITGAGRRIGLALAGPAGLIADAVLRQVVPDHLPHHLRGSQVTLGAQALEGSLLVRIDDVDRADGDRRIRFGMDHPVEIGRAHV